MQPRISLFTWASLLMLCATPARADAEPFEGFGSSIEGTQGTHHVMAARPNPPGELVMAFQGDYGVAHGLLVAGDYDVRQTLMASVRWSFLRSWELGLAGTVLSNQNSGLASGAAQSIGNPALSAKYGAQVASRLWLGAAARVVVPTSQQSSGLDLKRVVATMQGLLSWQFAHWGELGFNVGFIHDRGGDLSALNASQRLALGANSLQNRASAGLAVGALWDVASGVALGPFAELSGEWSPDAVAGAHNPIRASPGVKLVLYRPYALEMAAGVDLRVQGAPSATNAYPGLLPAMGFVRVVGSLGNAPERPVQPAREAPVAACPPAVCPAPVAASCETFVLTGKVTDASTGKVVPNAALRVGGFEGVSLAVDRQTGTFRSLPMPVGQGLVQLTVSAPDYVDAEQAIVKPAAGQVQTLDFSLVINDKRAPGRVRVSIRDARDGSPIGRAIIAVPRLRKTVKSNDEGAVELALASGTVELLITARGFTAQRKTVEVHRGDIIVFNVDLQPRRKDGRMSQ